MARSFWLFIFGIFIGACLEILLCELYEFKWGSNTAGTAGRSLRVNCLVLVKHKHFGYVNASKRTWLRHCDDHHIVNVRRIKAQAEIPHTCSNGEFCTPRTWETDDVVQVPARSAWAGLCRALHLVKSDRTDWLLVVTDSSVAIVENLKLFVQNFNSDETHYYGHAVGHYEADYNALSAGILLSRGSLRRLHRRFTTGNDCDKSGKYWRNEDLYLGKYLKEIGVFPKDTRDEDGRGRFHGFNLVNLLHPGKLFARSDYKRKALFPVPEGFNCCSPDLITLDVSGPDVILKLYYLLYKLATGQRSFRSTNGKMDGETGKVPKSFYWKDFLRDRGYSENAIENMSSEEYYKIWEKILPPEVMYKQMRDLVDRGKDEIF